MNQAYKFIAEGIEKGTFKQGAPLSEVEIANALNISRSPVREAFRKLESEGLLKHYAGRGTFVSELNRQDLEEIFELRLMFELCGLESAINYISDEKIEEFRQAFAHAYASGDYQEHARADAMLHNTIINSSGNERLKYFMSVLDAQIRVVKAFSRRISSLAATSYDTHIQILDAIQSRDYELAKERLEKHILEVRDKTFANMRNE